MSKEITNSRFLTNLKGLSIVMVAAIAFFRCDISFAEDLTFVITSEYEHIVDVEFYSQHRNVAWPGGNEVYSISDYKRHEYSLKCRYGEKICFGAGVRGNYSKYWGVGIGDKHGCTGCCATCDGGSTVNQVLNP